MSTEKSSEKVRDERKRKMELRISKIDQIKLNEMKENLKKLHNITYESEEPSSKEEMREKSERVDSNYILQDEKIMTEEEEDNKIEITEEIRFIKNLMAKQTVIKENPLTFTPFGHIRRDEQSNMNLNKQEFKLQKEKKNIQNVNKDPPSSYGNIFEEEYFKISEKEDSNEKVKNTEKDEENIFERQYFLDNFNQPENDLLSQNPNVSEGEESQNLQTNKKKTYWSRTLDELKEDKSLNYFDQMMLKETEGSCEKILNSGIDLKNKKKKTEDEKEEVENELLSNITKQNIPKVENLVVEPFTKRDLRGLSKETHNLKEPKNAFEQVLQIRRAQQNQNKPLVSNPPLNLVSKQLVSKQQQQEEKQIRKHQHILDLKPPDLEKMLCSDLVSMLDHSVLFENENILAIDKPCGLPSQDGSGITKSVASLLDELSSRRSKSRPLRYFLVHRLDKYTSGVMLLAKNEYTRDILNIMLRERQIKKTYWTLTKGVPRPNQGIIDIPMSEGMVAGKYRMHLSPAFSGNQKLNLNPVKTGKTFQATTNYKVLDHNSDLCALVECSPLTGVKHQIRCHFAFGLNTPLLGDHKFSHFSRIAPQKLHGDLLKLLNFRQQKVRDLDIFLHSKSIEIPEALEGGRGLVVQSRLPQRFLKALKWLRLTLPK